MTRHSKLRAKTLLAEIFIKVEPPESCTMIRLFGANE
jgi:hypothetical protein